MKVVTVFKGKTKTYNVRNKRQAYGRALAAYKALHGKAWI
jgi:hypothetical protein